MTKRLRKYREYYRADRLACAQGARSTQAVQTANIAAHLERLPLTSYQRVILAIIATASFGLILPTAGQSRVFALGAGAFVTAAMAVLILGEET